MKLRTMAALITLALIMTALAGPAGATLTNIGTATYGSNNYNLIYDDNPSGPIVWLDYTNPGIVWSNQVAWAGSLNSAIVTYNFLPGYSMNWTSNWALPTTVNGLSVNGYDGTTTAGFNITSSQMGYLYYTQLGNLGAFDTSGNTLTGFGLSNTGFFSNLLPGLYWSGTEYSGSSFGAWYFSTTNGVQNADTKGHLNLGLANRTGQLESAAVPEPATMLLLGLGLLGLAGVRRKLT